LLINHTNHPSDKWSDKQKQAAEIFGGVEDVPFPVVSAKYTEYEIKKLVEAQASLIICKHPQAVLCQGEYSYTYAMITKLKTMGIKVIAACSSRVTLEYVDADQYTHRESQFEFIQFREYI